MQDKQESGATVPTIRGRVQEMESQYNTDIIRELLNAAFSDEELTAVCFDFFKPVHDDFTVGVSRLTKIQLLLAHCTRYDKLENLLQIVQTKNSAQYAKFEPLLKQFPQITEIESNGGKTRLELTFPIDWVRVPPERRDALISALVGALAGVLGIPHDLIGVLQVRIGSLVLQLEMPTKSAARLIALYESSLPTMQDLGIEHISLIPQQPLQPVDLLSTLERAKLHQFLTTRFYLDELKELAFGIGVDHELLGHTTTHQLSRELITYFERRNRLSLLVIEVLKKRSDDGGSLALLLARLPPPPKTKKVRLITSDDLPKPVSSGLELSDDLFRMVKNELLLADDDAR